MAKITILTLTRTLTRTLGAILLAACGLPSTSAQSPAVEYKHLYTFGSRDGIHPPRILDSRPATVPLGRGEFPWGIGYPVAVAVDARRRVWITDSGTHSVHVFDQANGNYRELHRAGNTRFEQPSGIASDNAGRIYVTDAETGGVFVFDENGEYDRDLVHPGDRRLKRPEAIALSPDSRTIYIADTERNAIVELNREGELDQTILLTESFGEPCAVAQVENQLLVLSRVRHRISSFTQAGRTLGENRWDGIPAPTAFAWDPEHHRTLIANARLIIVEVFDGEQGVGFFGGPGDKADQMRRIDFLYADRYGLIYAVDSRNGKVLVFGEADVEHGG